MHVQRMNRAVWNQRVRAGDNPWTKPVTSEQVQNAKQGDWCIYLTPVKPVPAVWLGDVKQKKLLCLASGGGQQAPILAAAGAHVTVFDLSDEQLKQDRFVAERDQLRLRTVQGDMTDLSVFESASFDMIVHPISNCFIPDVQPVWHEANRVLKPGGRLLAGMVNPLLYALNDDASEAERLTISNTIPYVDSAEHTNEAQAIEFGHTLEDLIAGQLRAGFYLSGFYEDTFPAKPISVFINTLFATCATKAH